MSVFIYLIKKVLWAFLVRFRVFCGFLGISVVSCSVFCGGLRISRIPDLAVVLLSEGERTFVTDGIKVEIILL